LRAPNHFPRAEKKRKQLACYKATYYVCDVDSNFAFDVTETALAIRRAFDRRAAALGVTRAQWRLLSRLARQDGQRQVDLAEALDIEPITLCRIVDRLSDSGLVERRADQVDRRAWRIHLTERSQPVLTELKALSERFLGDILAGVSPDEQSATLRILEQVRANAAGSGGATRRAS
jgi:MarR family transcriptional regulator for hemolysin